MQSFDSPAAARTGITTFMMMHASELPQDIREKVIEMASSPSPVDQMVNTAELLYARADEVGPEGRDLAGSLAAYCALNGFHGMGLEDRGGRMAQAMRRENEEEPPAGMTFPKKESDPAPLTQYVKGSQGVTAPATDQNPA